MADRKCIYFMGIGGTGMAAVAGLAQAAGHRVVGSDLEIYPPMSILLDELAIPVYKGYRPEHIQEAKPDLVVIANALSRGNPELEYVLANQIPYTSFPGLLKELFLTQKTPIVVTGTHGKTTTTSLIAHLLVAFNEDPSYMIGGIPKNLHRSFALGNGPLFVIEGDEYDTAFFDKGPKFLHYAPQFLLINNIEFDHADIYKDLDEIKSRFVELIKLVPNSSHIIANSDDPEVCDCLREAGVKAKLISLAAINSNSASKPSTPYPESVEIDNSGNTPTWIVSFETTYWGSIKVRMQLSGIYNVYNMTQSLACLETLIEANALAKIPSQAMLIEGLESFAGVARRLDYLGGVGGIQIYEDFAHHPTAVAHVIANLRKSHPESRLLVAFEPKNATSRRSVFADRYIDALSHADAAFIGVCPEDKRIPADQRMDTFALADRIGASAQAFHSNEDLQHKMAEVAKPGDILLFMSAGSFSGVQHAIKAELSSRTEK